MMDREPIVERVGEEPDDGGLATFREHPLRPAYEAAFASLLEPFAAGPVREAAALLSRGIVRTDGAAWGEGVRAGTRELVLNFERCVRLNPQFPDAEGKIRAMVEGDVLPDLSDPSVVALVGAEAIAAHDPEGALRAWLDALDDHGTPDKPPPLPPVPPLPGGRPHPGVSRALLDIAGLHGWYNALDDLIAIHTDAARVARAVAWRRDEGARLARDAVASVRVLLERVDGMHPSVAASATWEWRHVATLARTLSVRTNAPPALVDAGFVTVIVAGASPYEVLGALHTARPCLPDRFRDWVSPRRDGAYKALHTALRVAMPGGERSVAVRIFSAEAAGSRDLPPRVAIAQLRSRVGRDHIRVYTPAGDILRLRVGSTVLNAAHAVRPVFVTRVTGAVVNGADAVGPLHRLNDGDCVELKLTEASAALPEGWEAAVPPDTRSSILTGGKFGAREYYDRLGREWLLARLRERDLPAFTEERLMPLVEAADGLARAKNILPRDQGKTYMARSWLREIGRWRAGGAPPDSRISIDAEKLLACMVEATVIISGLRLPADLADRAGNVEVCPDCRPSSRDELAVARKGEDGLVVHRRGWEKCAHEAIPVDRAALLRQYVTVHASGRAAVLRDVAAVFAVASIDLLEAVARPDDGGRLVARFEIDPPEHAILQRTLARLASLPTVRRVLGPSDPVDPELEQYLPPRQTGRIPGLVRSNPYPYAAEVLRDEQFAGREPLLAELRAVLDQARAPGSMVGAAVYITGGFKMGKTSLALRLARDDWREPRYPVLVAYARADYAGWGTVSARLAETLRQRHAALVDAGRLGPRALPDGGDLAAVADAILAARECPRVLLVVDEVASLVRSTIAAGESPDAIAQFARRFVAHPGAAVLWVGPQPAMRLLPESEFVRHLLADIRRVPVGPFTAEETAELLAAEKQPGRVNARSARSVAARLYAEARGDPYFTVALAGVMYGLARARSGGGPVSYTEDDVVAAARRVLDEAHIPMQRLYGLQVGTRAAMAGLLERLAEGPLGADEPGRRGLREEEGPLVDHLLDHGLVEADGPRVRILAPILATWLRSPTGRRYLAGSDRS